ncbi:hypothetical protein L1887_08932 [Cichorium endivia]|nr:hypothetical protein L1887_08932 [Cichorium endivia]
MSLTSATTLHPYSTHRHYLTTPCPCSRVEGKISVGPYKKKERNTTHSITSSLPCKCELRKQAAPPLISATNKGRQT